MRSCAQAAGAAAAMSIREMSVFFIQFPRTATQVSGKYPPIATHRQFNTCTPRRGFAYGFNRRKVGSEAALHPCRGTTKKGGLRRLSVRIGLLASHYRE